MSDINPPLKKGKKSNKNNETLIFVTISNYESMKPSLLIKDFFFANQSQVLQLTCCFFRRFKTCDEDYCVYDDYQDGNQSIIKNQFSLSFFYLFTSLIFSTFLFVCHSLFAYHHPNLINVV